jgi:hypothetical protein
MLINIKAFALYLRGLMNDSKVYATLVIFSPDNFGAPVYNDSHMRTFMGDTAVLAYMERVNKEVADYVKDI